LFISLHAWDALHPNKPLITGHPPQLLEQPPLGVRGRLAPNDVLGVFARTISRYALARIGRVRGETRSRLSAGLGICHLLVQCLGLADAIDRDLHLLERHLPIFESDHVLNLAYNPLAGGRCLQDLELLRHDETYLDALGAPRSPTPPAGDFLRRFGAADIDTRMCVLNHTRVRVWRR
jgi:hypothetical protein